jgi:thioesterase domain-containing protein
MLPPAGPIESAAPAQKGASAAPTLPPGGAIDGAPSHEKVTGATSTLRPGGAPPPTPPSDEDDIEPGPMTLRSHALRTVIQPPPTKETRRSLSVRLQEGVHGKVPLFLFPPVGGTVYTYMELTRHLRADRPVYAFRASGTEPGEPIYEEIPVMAARYMDEVLKVQPEGPYLLGGHSGGGTIAYEMACQLAERRSEPILVWMADSGFTTQYQRMNVIGVEQVLDNLRAFKDIAPRTWNTFTAALADDPMLRELVVSNYKALACYHPKRTSAEVVYIRAAERDAVLDKHPEAGWMDLAAGPFTVHNAPGNHMTMIEAPCAVALARIVQQHMDLFFTKDTPVTIAREM